MSSKILNMKIALHVFVYKRRDIADKNDETSIRIQVSSFTKKRGEDNERSVVVLKRNNINYNTIPLELICKDLQPEYG